MNAIHLVQILAEAAEIQWDVICFFETRALDGVMTLEGGHRLDCNSGEYICASIAVLVHAHWVSCILSTTRISDRLLYVDLLAWVSSVDL